MTLSKYIFFSAFERKRQRSTTINNKNTQTCKKYYR